MLNDQERMSLVEIEDHLRASDEDLVRAFEILTRIGGQRPPSRRRPAPAPAPAPRPRPVPPPGSPSAHRGALLPPSRPQARPAVHRPEPPRVPPRRHTPPAAAAPARPGPHRERSRLMRLVQWMLLAAVLLPLVTFGVAVFSRDAATLVLCAAFGALAGLVGYATAVAVRARRR